jgi:hypothetical protein
MTDAMQLSLFRTITAFDDVEKFPLEMFRWFLRTASPPFATSKHAVQYGFARFVALGF